MTQSPSDLFKKKKGVHVQLDKDTHAYFRRELFMVGVSMQEVFEFFAQLIASGDHRAKRLLESYVTNKLRREIEDTVTSLKRELPKFGELDSERLYNLISKADDLVDKEVETDDQREN